MATSPQGTSAHKYFWQSSDFIAGMMAVVAVVIEHFVPSSFGLETLARVSVGIAILCTAWSIIFLAKREFSTHREATKPGVPTTQILTTGILGYSRNPIYVGVLLLPIALGLLFDSVWIALSSVPSLFLFHYVLVLPEEQYLSERFGDAYLAYVKAVRRWF